MADSGRKRFPVKSSAPAVDEPLVPVFAGPTPRLYARHYKIKLGHDFEVVTPRVPRYGSQNFAMIRRLRRKTPGRLVDLLRLREFHPNIVHNLELYDCGEDTEFYELVTEYMPTSVLHMCWAPFYLSEPQLSSVLSQALCGAAFLADSGWVHETLSCTHLLISDDGNLKISDVENCKYKGDKARLVNSVAVVMMQLMDKSKTERSQLEISPRWWSGEALDLFNKAQSSCELSELIKHDFNDKQDRTELRWFIHFTLLRVNHDVQVLKKDIPEDDVSSKTVSSGTPLPRRYENKYIDLA